MTTDVYLLAGIPASGKSTWAKKHADADWTDHITAVTISRDAVRKAMGNTGDKYSPTVEQKVFKTFIDSANESMKDGIEHVYIDATHVQASNRYQVISRLIPPENCTLHIVYFNSSLRDALVRNAERPADEQVPEMAIANMYVKFEKPTMKEYERGTYMFKSIVIEEAKA